MSTPEYKRVQRGDRAIPANLLNGHTEAIEALREPTLPDGGQDFGQPAMPLQAPLSFLAVIIDKDTSTPIRHRWQRALDPATDGSAGYDPDVIEGGPGAALDALPAFEENNSPDVPIGAVVRLWWSWRGECLVFSYPGASGVGTRTLRARLYTRALTISYTYSAGPPATLTGDLPGWLTDNVGPSVDTVDNEVPLVGDRILLDDENVDGHSGLWMVKQQGTTLLPYILQRPPEADTTAKHHPGVLCVVMRGRTHADQLWELQTGEPSPVFVLDSTKQLWKNFAPPRQFEVTAADEFLDTLMDGVSINPGNRVLVFGTAPLGTNASGIWERLPPPYGSPPANPGWRRPVEAMHPGDVPPGSTCRVREGDNYKDSEFLLNVPDDPNYVMDGTAQHWRLMSPIRCQENSVLKARRPHLNFKAGPGLIVVVEDEGNTKDQAKITYSAKGVVGGTGSAPPPVGPPFKVENGLPFIWDPVRELWIELCVCGEQSGSGSGAGGSEEECCPGVVIPDTLHYEIIDEIGCACADGDSGELVRPAPGPWLAKVRITCPGGKAMDLSLLCTAGVWRLTTVAGADTCVDLVPDPGASFSCDPLYMEFVCDQVEEFCGIPGAIRIVVTL